MARVPTIKLRVQLDGATETLRRAYLQSIGLDPDRTLLAPVAIEAIGKTDEPVRVEAVDKGNGAADIIITPLEWRDCDEDGGRYLVPTVAQRDAMTKPLCEHGCLQGEACRHLPCPALAFLRSEPWPTASCCGEPRVTRNVDRCYDHAKSCEHCGAGPIEASPCQRCRDEKGA